MTETQRIVAPEAAVRLVHRGMLRDYLDEQQPTADPWHNRHVAGDLEELMHAWIEAARAAERLHAREPQQQADATLAATVRAIRWCASLAFHTDERLAQDLYATASDVQGLGLDSIADCCPVCQEITCDTDCPLEDLRAAL